MWTCLGGSRHMVDLFVCLFVLRQDPLTGLEAIIVIVGR